MARSADPGEWDWGLKRHLTFVRAVENNYNARQLLQTLPFVDGGLVSQMYWSVIFATHATSCQSAVEFISERIITTQPSINPPSGWLTKL